MSSIQQLPFSSPKICPSHPSLQNPTKNDNKKFYSFNYVRFLILALSTICLSLTVGSSLAFNFTMICMDEGNTLSTTSLPKNYKKQEPLKERLNQDDNKWQKDWLLSVVAVGTLLGTLPINWITEKLGIRLIKYFFIFL
ncbi:MFS domain-containing protein [Meloidogyne graminicola]|uniref:MFS domain-containing protein n=1 Tax=Meloidogyne graminicola TaxID=189291 RepID=A0A8S9ZI68_9BILA|nr:MFS domain-containing protein [Meloidogyne graminicola]